MEKKEIENYFYRSNRYTFIFFKNEYICTYLIYLQKYLGIGISNHFYVAKLCQLNYLCLTKR